MVVQWTRDGTERCSGLETFDINSGAFVGRVYDGHQHGDLGIMADGVMEFFMTYELYHPSGQLALGYRVLPGNATVQDPVYLRTLDWVGDHISCQGLAGVCLITTVADSSNGWSALEGEPVFAIFGWLGGAVGASPVQWVRILGAATSEPVARWKLCHLRHRLGQRHLQLTG